MDAVEIAGGTLGSLNFAAAAVVGSLLPLCAEIDAFIGINIGPLTADLQAQFHASLDFSLNATIGISNPFLSVQLALSAIVQLQAALQAALVLPSITIGINAGITAAASLAAALEIKLGLLNAAVKALLVLKIGSVELAGLVAARLSAGPAVLVEFGGAGASTLAMNGADINTLFASGLSLGGGISPFDTSFGYILVTKAPAAKAGLDFILRGI
jgi:hypothetical protein